MRRETMNASARIAVSALVAACLLPAFAGAQVDITITKQYARKTVIAVPSFARQEGGDEKLSRSLAEMLKSDLDASGYFDTVKKQQFADETDREDRQRGRIDLQEWTRLRAEMVVKTEVAVRGAALSLTSRLYAVRDGKNLFSQAYRGELSASAQLIHRLANDIIKAVTGETGLCGTQIAFVSDASGMKQICLMEYGSAAYRQVTSGKNISLFPSWTPDAGSLVFTSYVRGFPELFLMDLGSRNARAIASFPGLNAFGDVSPDGREMLLTLSRSGNPELYRMELASGTVTRLTRTAWIESSPCWSPDGRQIAFVSDQTGSPQIYLMDARGKTPPKRLTFKGSYNTEPDWSPDGESIVYSSRQGGFGIWLVNLKTREEIPLPRSGSSDEAPSWAPDSRHIVYCVQRGRKRDLFIMDVYDRAPTQITRGPGNFSSPAWAHR